MNTKDGLRAVRVVVIIPAYNEATSVGVVVEGVRKVLPAAEIVLVDDGSTDGTPKEAAGHGATVISHPFNMGYGVALQTGFRYAQHRGADYVVQMDADRQHDPADLPVLLEAVTSGAFDMVVGSRFLHSGSYRPSLARRTGIRLFALVTSFLIRGRITDSTSGYQAFGRAGIRFNASDEFPTDYPDADLILMVHRAGLKIAEVPVCMRANASGRSMHGGLFGTAYYIFRMFLSLAVILMRKTAKSVPHRRRAE